MVVKWCLGLLLLVAVASCYGADVPQPAPGLPAVASTPQSGQPGPYKPYAVLVSAYARKDRDAAFSLSDLKQWINAVHDSLGVDYSNMIVVTPRASVLAEGQDVQTVLPGILAGNYLAKGGICDILRIMQGRKVEGVKRLGQDFTHVYLLVAMHGSSANRDADELTTEIATGGGTLVPHRTAANTRCPSDIKLVLQKTSTEKGWMFGGSLYRWMAEQQPAHRKFVVFVDSCYSASFFTKLVQRVDEHHGMAATENLAQAKLALYDAKLRLPRTLILTSGADNCATSDDQFLTWVTEGLATGHRAHETWGWMLDQLKQASRVEAKNRKYFPPPIADRQFSWAQRIAGDTRPVVKGTMRAVQVRAFGDPHMLSEKIRPDMASDHAGTLPDFARQLQNGQIADVQVVRNKGAPMPEQEKKKKKPTSTVTLKKKKKAAAAASF